MTLRLQEGWVVREVEHADAAKVVRALHYSGGCSRTSVLNTGLFSPSGHLVGVSMWLPPPPGSAAWVSRSTGCATRRVVSLSRLAIVDEVPRNAASFLLSRSVRRLKGWDVAVSYADEGEGHTGGVYLACNWTYAGHGPATVRWRDAEGRIRSAKATRNLTVTEMRNRGWRRGLPTVKHRYLFPIHRQYRVPIAALAQPPPRPAANQLPYIVDDLSTSG